MNVSTVIIVPRRLSGRPSEPRPKSGPSRPAGELSAGRWLAFFSPSSRRKLSSGPRGWPKSVLFGPKGGTSRVVLSRRQSQRDTAGPVLSCERADLDLKSILLSGQIFASSVRAASSFSNSLSLDLSPREETGAARSALSVCLSIWGAFVGPKWPPNGPIFGPSPFCRACPSRLALACWASGWPLEAAPRGPHSSEPK